MSKNVSSNLSRFAFRQAIIEDSKVLAELHTAVAAKLTEDHGQGPWSSKTSEKGVLYAMRNSRVFVVHDSGEIIGTFRLATKKPWAIDTKYFSKCARPLYLLAMAVAPDKQRHGIGGRCIEEAERIARDLKADAIRLDAYDAEAGAGGFYARCRFKEVGRISYRNAPLIYFERLLA